MLRAIDKLEPFQKAISKAHLASAGVSIDSLDHKPLIAIANSWNEICPGHEPLKQLAEEVKKGILEAGGEPIEFNTVACVTALPRGILVCVTACPTGKLSRIPSRPWWWERACLTEWCTWLL